MSSRSTMSTFKGTREGLGLALSGGGFRATLFHLGALWRLNELGILSQVSRISSVSGGSILNGLLSIKWDSLDFKEGVATNFGETVVPPIRALCGQTLDVRAVFYGLFQGAVPLVREYSKRLVGDATLQDVPDYPDFVFNATHIESGRAWYFSKSKMETYRLGVVESPRFALAKVIAASSACPPFFPPVVINVDPGEFLGTDLSVQFEEEGYDKSRVHLTDGGVYDNLGMQKIMPYKIQLYSDASGPLATKGNRWTRWFKNRVLNPNSILMEQTRSLRRREIVSDFKAGTARGALWTISTPMKNYGLSENPYIVPSGLENAMSHIQTRLKALSDEVIAALINWGYVQCDCSMRANFLGDAYVPSSVLPYEPKQLQPGRVLK